MSAFGDTFMANVMQQGGPQGPSPPPIGRELPQGSTEEGVKELFHMMEKGVDREQVRRGSIVDGVAGFERQGEPAQPNP